jgi:hypothetical protein
MAGALTIPAVHGVLLTEQVTCLLLFQKTRHGRPCFCGTLPVQIMSGSRKGLKLCTRQCLAQSGLDIRAEHLVAIAPKAQSFVQPGRWPMGYSSGRRRQTCPSFWSVRT